MRKHLLCYASLLLACIGGFKTTHAQSTHTLLWKISGKNLQKPSYLYGTMHILCADDANLSDNLKKVIADCDEVYFEIDLSNISAMMGSMKYMRMQNDQKLSNLLNDSDYAKVKTYFSAHVSLPFSILEQFKPMLISSLIEEEGLGCKTTDGMELMIMKELHPYKKPVKGLETVEFQAGLFDSIPYDQQAKDLLNYIDSADEYKKMTIQLAAVYKDQDLDRLDELSRKGDLGLSNYMDLLLYNRNRKWANNLDTLLPGKSLLIAVGAAHLPGTKGVINLLREKGYTVTPVKNN